MDANKRRRLIELDYEIAPACGACEHSRFRPGSDFGDCQVNTYVHEKHTVGEKPLSINRYGSCGSYEPGASFLNTLGLWGEFAIKAQ